MVHGRSQENKDSKALKAEWVQSWRDGLAKSHLDLPIPTSHIHFPFYGDTLYDMVNGKPAEEAAAVIVRGLDADKTAEQFALALLLELCDREGITENMILEVTDEAVLRRGILNWERVQSILKAIDRYVPGSSGASIALFTHDVFKYLTNKGIRRKIDDGVISAFVLGDETVVVSHSLGTVVAYNVLRQQQNFAHWKVPLFVTLGSPLGVKQIRKKIRELGPARCPACSTAWFNAMDERDVVALYPLTPKRFPLDPINPAITNKTDVDNDTKNRHGITGYLKDKDVAKRIHDALVA